MLLLRVSMIFLLALVFHSPVDAQATAQRQQQLIEDGVMNSMSNYSQQHGVPTNSSSDRHGRMKRRWVMFMTCISNKVPQPETAISCKNRYVQTRSVRLRDDLELSLAGVEELMREISRTENVVYNEEDPTFSRWRVFLRCIETPVPEHTGCTRRTPSQRNYRIEIARLNWWYCADRADVNMNQFTGIQCSKTTPVPVHGNGLWPGNLRIREGEV